MGGVSLGRGLRCLEQEGSQAKHEGESREYKAHGLTTISGCVMMGMGEGAADTETKPE